MSMPDGDAVERRAELLEAWVSRVRLSQHSQHHAGKFCLVGHQMLATISTAAPAVLGAVAMWYLEKSIPTSAKLIMIAGGALASIFGIVELVLRLDIRAAEHAKRGTEYGQCRRRIEMVLVERESITSDDLKAIKEEIDALAERPPVVSDWVFSYTKLMLRQKPST